MPSSSSNNNNKATRARKTETMIPRAAAEPDAGEAAAAPAASADTGEEYTGEESNFWKKIFLKEGQEEVSSADYQKFQAELNAKKAAAKAQAGDKAACIIM